MTKGLRTKRFVQFAALAILAGEVSYVAAEVLVLRSGGPTAGRRYPAGQRLPDNATFTLRAGDSVAILSRTGTRTLRGPGTCNASGQGCSGRLASANVRIGTGASRGPGDGNGPVPTDVWQVDVTSSGRVCVATGARPTLWRPAWDRPVQLTITPQTGAPQTVHWAQGQATVAWPDSIPIVDGASYQLSWTGGAAPTRLTARAVPQVPSGDLATLATALMANQCRGQLDTLIAQNEPRPPAAGGAGAQ